MLKRVFGVLAALLVPSVLAAQNPKVAAPNEHASDVAKEKVAAAMARRATHVRGEAVSPATPATRATRATPATPSTGEGPATRATPAAPATPATPASPSQRPDHAGQGGQGRGSNPRRP